MRLLFVAALAVALLSVEVAGAASSAFPTFLTEGAAAAAGVLPPPAAGHAPFPSCPSLGVIGTRGSGERSGRPDWGEGLGPPNDKLARYVQKQLPAAQYTYTNYPALPVLPASIKTAIPDALNGLGAKLRKYWIGAYHDSLIKGEAALRGMVLAQMQACGMRTRLLLAGYSQGAQITGSVYLSLDRASRAVIAGVALFGDPTFNRKSRIAVDHTLDHDGILGPRRASFPKETQTRIRSYCHPTDPVCQGWTQIIHWTAAHKTYPRVDALNAAAMLTPPLVPAQVATICGAGQPLVDVNFDYRHLLEITPRPERRFWGYEAGHARSQIWQTGENTFCQYQSGSGRFVTVSGLSPRRSGRLRNGITGHVDWWAISRITGTFRPTRPTTGYLGKTDYNCVIKADRTQANCYNPRPGEAFEPLFFWFPDGSRTAGVTGESRFTRKNLQTLWEGPTVNLGDITG